MGEAPKQWSYLFHYRRNQAGRVPFSAEIFARTVGQTFGCVPLCCPNFPGLLADQDVCPTV